MYKAIFVDLDGTLLDDSKKISKENLDAIEYAKSKNVEVVICSGRQKELILDYKNQIKGNYIICCNGSEIFDCNSKQTLFMSRMDPRLIYQIYDYAMENNLYLRLDTKYGRFITSKEIFIEKEVMLEEDILEFLANYDVLQITVVADNIDSISKFGQEFISNKIRYENLYTYTQNDKKYCALNIINEGVSKGNALEGLCKYLKINVEDVIAIGDDPNDISMIKVAGQGVAMGNGREELKEIANRVTSTNMENGVAKAIYDLIK